LLDRVDFSSTSQIDLLLSEVQEKAYDAIKSNFVQKEVCLLHGVSSGKTEIYIKLIEGYLASAEQILYVT
jgi:primosomal protein N' (replication factor Y)